MKSLFSIIAICFSSFTFSQSIINVSPNVVAPGTITGTISFEGNLTFWNTGAGLYQIVLIGPNDTIWPASQNIIDDTHAEATYLIPTSADTGCYDVRGFDLIADTVWMFCGMTVSPTAGIDQLSLSNHVKAYPNPVQESITIEVSTPVKDGYTVEIFDASGKKEKEIFSSEETITFQRNEFQSGLYYYKASSADGLIGQGKFVVK